MKFHRGLVNPAKDLESFKGLLKRIESEANDCFLICLKNTGRIIGTINLSQIFHRSFKNAPFGYYLFENFPGKGFMTEEFELAIRFAFR